MFLPKNNLSNRIFLTELSLSCSILYLTKLFCARGSGKGEGEGQTESEELAGAKTSNLSPLPLPQKTPNFLALSLHPLQVLPYRIIDFGQQLKTRWRTPGLLHKKRKKKTWFALPHIIVMHHAPSWNDAVLILHQSRPHCSMAGAGVIGNVRFWAVTKVLFFSLDKKSVGRVWREIAATKCDWRNYPSATVPVTGTRWASARCRRTWRTSEPVMCHVISGALWRNLNIPRLPPFSLRHYSKGLQKAEVELIDGRSKPNANDQKVVVHLSSSAFFVEEESEMQPQVTAQTSLVSASHYIFFSKRWFQKENHFSLIIGKNIFNHEILLSMYH